MHFQTPNLINADTKPDGIRDSFSVTRRGLCSQLPFENQFDKLDTKQPPSRRFQLIKTFAICNGTELVNWNGCEFLFALDYPASQEQLSQRQTTLICLMQFRDSRNFHITLMLYASGILYENVLYSIRYISFCESNERPLFYFFGKNLI